MVSGSICPLGATAHCRGRGSGTGQWGWRLPEPGGTTHTGARPGSSARWYRPHYRLLLGSAGGSDVVACGWSV
jgi:hypothetical protein